MWKRLIRLAAFARSHLHTAIDLDTTPTTTTTTIARDRISTSAVAIEHVLVAAESAASVCRIGERWRLGALHRSRWMPDA